MFSSKVSFAHNNMFNVKGAMEPKQLEVWLLAYYTAKHTKKRFRV